jgi:hypothetical protein
VKEKGGLDARLDACLNGAHPLGDERSLPIPSGAPVERAHVFHALIGRAHDDISMIEQPSLSTWQCNCQDSAQAIQKPVFS